MRDAALLFPVFVTGALVLQALAGDAGGYHHNPNITTYLVFLGCLFGLLYRWHGGKQRAAERMRAIELGHDPVAFGPAWFPGGGLLTIGAGVPLAAFAIAWQASVSMPSLGPAAWFAASVVAVTALVCGTFLMTRLPASAFAPQSPWRGRNGVHDPKPAVNDPDAFDVAGRRGGPGG